MSLVGPRPCLINQTDLLAAQLEHPLAAVAEGKYDQAESIAPGIYY